MDRAGGTAPPVTRACGDEQHLARAARERPVAPAVERLLDDQARVGAQLGEPRGGVEPDAVLALAAAARALPGGAHGEHAGERVEGALVADHRAVVALPPVALEEARHHAVAAAAVPHEHAARREHARELRDHAPVVARVEEEAERGEEVDDRVEATRPPRRQAAHVAARVAQRASGAARAGGVEQRLGVVEAVDVVAGLGEQVRVAPLPAGAVEDARAGRQREQVDEPRDLPAVALRREERLVLLQVVGVEVGRPPVGGAGLRAPGRRRRARRAQKNTGSR
jgi:hypothetical protein